MSSGTAEELYTVSRERQYTRFMDVLVVIDQETSLDSRQLDILIKIDFFSEFGNQRELLRITDIFTNMLKKGQAKQLNRSIVDGTPLEQIVSKYAVGITKSGGIAKSYTILDVGSIMHEFEDVIKSIKMDDLSDVIKVQNFKDIMGYAGYVSGKEQDRPKLYVTGIYPLTRKKDGAQFGYSVKTKSIGSGIESRFSVMNRVFNKQPIQEGDIIFCKSYIKDKSYYVMNAYDILY